MSDSLQPRGQQHASLPCPSPFLEFAQTRIHWVGDAIQPSHPLLPSCPLAFNLSQHQGLFHWVSCLHQVAKVLELQNWWSTAKNAFRNLYFWMITCQKKKDWTSTDLRSKQKDNRRSPQKCRKILIKKSRNQWYDRKKNNNLSAERSIWYNLTFHDIKKIQK